MSRFEVGRTYETKPRNNGIRYRMTVTNRTRCFITVYRYSCVAGKRIRIYRDANGNEVAYPFGRADVMNIPVLDSTRMVASDFAYLENLA